MTAIFTLKSKCKFCKFKFSHSYSANLPQKDSDKTNEAPISIYTQSSKEMFDYVNWQL